MPIPPDIDELMWAIAENDTPDAVYDFEHRFPKYQQELLRRIKTVKALKSQGREAPSREIPIFQARPAAVDPRPTQWLGIVAVSVAVISTAVLAATRPRAERVPLPAPVETGVRSHKPIQAPIDVQPAPPPVQQAQPPVDPAKVPPQPKSNEAKRFDAIVEVAKLSDAIQMIAMSGGVNVTIAPGLENPDVKLNFTQMTAMEMLTALGKDYAFTPVINGEREILILPVKEDPGPPTEDSELH